MEIERVQYSVDLNEITDLEIEKKQRPSLDKSVAWSLLNKRGLASI